MAQEVAWGRYQAGASVLMALLKMPAAWFQLSLLFLGPDITHRCIQPTNNQSVLVASESENLTQVWKWDEACTYLHENGSERFCTHFEYFSEHYTYTVNMQYHLVCDRKFLVTWGQLAIMIGVTVGNAIGGLLADRVGRKPVLVAGVVLQPVMSAMVALSPTFPLFLLFRFLTGFSLGNAMVISFILGAELVNDHWRPIIAILHQVPFGMGQTIVSLTSYFLRDWRDMQMALSVHSLIFLPYCWLVEESPKWLRDTGRLKQAEQVTEIIRRRNGLSSNLPAEMHPMTEKMDVQIVKTADKKVNNNSKKVKGAVGFLDLFRTPRLCRYTLSVWAMWYCAGLSFFALNAYQPALGSSPFINIGIGGLVGGIPGNILTIFLVRWFGRKRVILIAHLFISIFVMLIPIYDVGDSVEDWQRRIFALLAFVAMSIGYPALFLLSAELLPSVLRGSAMGVANLMGRLGNTTAPLVGPLGEYNKWLPLCIIAAAPLISAAIMLFIPDTWNKRLPDTIQDIETADYR